MSGWDLSFKAMTNLIEPCTGCGDEIEVSGDGSTTCPKCGWREVLPCAECSYLNGEKCDWLRGVRCSPFYRGKK